MTILRIILLVALFGGCAYVVMRAPWQAQLAPSKISSDLADAPLWAPPEAPGIEAFEQFRFLKDGPPQGMEIVVVLNSRKFFGLLSVVIVGAFFLFGIVGTIIQKRPETSDVAFSLWLSLGLLAGVVASAMIGQAMSREQFPFFSECFLVGFVAGLLIAIRSRTRLPLGEASEKS
jgi:hypothetical protein